MSGSPKYCSVDLAAARRAQAERERAERVRRREEKRRKNLAKALERTRATAARRCASLATRHAALRESAATAGLGAEAAGQEAAVAQVAAEIAGAANHPALVVASRRLDLLEQRIDSLSDAIILSQEVTAVTRLGRLSSRLEEISRDERLDLDSTGGQTAEATLPTAATASGESADDAALRVAERLDRARRAQAERAAAIRDAELRMEEQGARLEALGADGHDLGVEVDGATYAYDYLVRMRGLAADGRLDELTTMITEFTAALDRTERRFDDAVERIVERRHFLASIVAGLSGMDFEVIEGSQVERPDGSLSIRARTVAGDAVDVLVQDGEQTPHEVLYSSPALAAEDAEGTVTGSTCGSLVNLAEALNRRAGEAGYVIGAVSWADDGPGPDEGHTAVRLPRSGPNMGITRG